jgi:hypothetical protein
MNILEIIKDKKYFCNGDNSHYRNIEEVKDNKLYFCAYGGGFVQTISLTNENFLNDIKDKKIIFTNEEPKEEFHLGKIYIDSYDNYPKNFVEGYIHNHRFWNGWNIVFMTLEGIKKHNEHIKNSSYYSDNWEPKEEFNPTFEIKDNDTIILYDPEEEGGKVEIKSTEILYEGKKIKVFDPFSMSWCWQEITK